MTGGLSLLTALVDRLESQESLDLEFKAAQGGLPKSLWETVSAFANTNGGWIVLGVDSSEHPARLIGVPNAEQRLEEFYSLLHDPQKISYVVCGPNDALVEDVGGNKVIVIRVPAAPLKERPVYINNHPFRGTFVRGHSGDFHCNENDVKRMMREASDTTADSTVLDYLGFEDLDPEAIRNYRQRFQNSNPNSPFNGFDDREFLLAIDAYRRDPQTNKEGVTVAGLLMFGTPTAIRQRRTRHLIDFRIVSGDQSWDYRWDHRITCEGNLLDAFEQIYPPLVADLPVPFRLDGPVRRNEGPMHVALREALVNLLVHADYSETRASRIERSPQSFYFSNPGTSRIPAHELGRVAESNPRNPILVRMMRQIGLADEAGSGMQKIYGAWRESQLVPPKIEVDTERYEFRILLRYVHLLDDDDRRWLRSLDAQFSEAEQLALLTARSDGSVDNATLCSLTGLHPADATKILGGLRDRGFLSRRGWARGTTYELTDLATSPLSAVDNASSVTDIAGKASSTSNGDSSTNSDTSSVNVQSQLEDIAAPLRVRGRLSPEERNQGVLRLCSITPLSVGDLTKLLNKSRGTVHTAIRELMASGMLRYYYQDQPTHPRQRYVATGSSAREESR